MQMKIMFKDILLLLHNSEEIEGIDEFPRSLSSNE